jgi:hypothetical protein
MEDEMGSMLDDKDDQLRQAAELGQSLLARAAELERVNAQLLGERDQALTDLDDYEYRMKELSMEAASLNELMRAKEDAVSSMEAELETARQRYPADVSTSASPGLRFAETQRHDDQRLQGEIAVLKEDALALKTKESALLQQIRQESLDRRKLERSLALRSDQLASAQEQLRSVDKRMEERGLDSCLVEDL